MVAEEDVGEKEQSRKKQRFMNVKMPLSKKRTIVGGKDDDMDITEGIPFTCKLCHSSHPDLPSICLHLASKHYQDRLNEEYPALFRSTCGKGFTPGDSVGRHVMTMHEVVLE